MRLEIKDRFLEIRLRWIWYTFYFFVVSVFIFLFASLGQVVVNRGLAEKDLTNKSGTYDYVLNMPGASKYKEITDKNPVLNKNLKEELRNLFAKSNPNQDKNNDFEYIYSRSAQHYSSDHKFLLNIQTVSPMNQKFNQLVLTPDSKRPTEIGKGVLNERFYHANKDKFRNTIPVLDSSIEIVGTGSQVNGYSFGYGESASINKIIATASEEKKLYDQGGWLYVTDEQFDSWIASGNIFEYKNSVYLKANSKDKVESSLNHFKDTFAQKTNYIIDFNSFNGDLNSGLKMMINNKSNWIFGIIFMFSFLAILVLSFFFCDQEIKKNKKNILNLKALGINRWNISFFHTIKDFVFLIITCVIAYLCNFFLYNFFADLTLSSVNLVLPNSAITWWGFGFFGLLIPVIWSISMYNFNLYRIHKLFKVYVESKPVSSVQIFLEKKIHRLQQFRIFSGSYFKIFNLFFLKNLFKKISIFFLSIFLIILSFLLIFINASFKNFSQGQFNFLNSEVKSITELKDTLSLNEKGEIVNSILSIPVDKNLKSINSQAHQQPKFIKDFHDLKETFVQIALKSPNEEIAPSILNSDTDINAVKEMLAEANFDSIHLNQMPYNPKIDFPALRLKVEITKENTSLKFLYQNKTTSFESQIFFLPNLPEQNVRDYLSIFDHIEDKEANFVLKENGKLGLDNQQNSYALVSSDFRDVHGYKTGDLIELKLKAGNEFVDGVERFRIAGFVAPNILLSSLIFTDYDYLNRENKINSEQSNYNLFFTKGNKKHIDRYAVIDRTRSFNNLLMSNPAQIDIDSLNMDLFVVANQNSLSLKEFEQLNTYHFDFFYVLFVVILSLNIFFVFFLLLLISEFLFDSNRRTFINLRINGYRVREFSVISTIFFVSQFLFAGFLAFCISYFIFSLIAWKFVLNGIILVISGASFYLLYMLLGLLVFLFLNNFYQLWCFKKQKLVYSKTVIA